MGLTGGAAQGLSTNPQGYFLITPLVRDDNTVVYVNRGWVPKPTQKQTQAQGGQWSRPTGRVSLEAVVAEPEKESTFSPQNDPLSGVLIWAQPSALLAAA
eukprot:CAMPEP_0173274370 /NCGR_PEP_ID=MMETSP1143-20121109/2404_1 /TAXON_ID=483371 /ORGANISM="non described non described, Strain CCMP2298" /LENGTH=99 /DNA_ID=CAMNT_0014211177 /DNA_START=255 /DNA_END=550 /DNA_ORIENTATION=-